jgi:hypothetical protein
MTDGGEVALVLGVLELDLLLLQQSLAEFLNFLFVHLSSSLSSKTLMVSQPGNGSICFTIAVSTGSSPVEFSTDHPQLRFEAPSDRN